MIPRSADTIEGPNYTIQKEGFIPVKQEKVFTIRKELAVDDDLPLGDVYRQFIPDNLLKRLKMFNSMT